MAARKRKIMLTDEWKARISAGRIMGRLIEHVDGTIDMTPSQVNAARILLGKIVPDLSAVSMDGKLDLSVNWPVFPPAIER